MRTLDYTRERLQFERLDRNEQHRRTGPFLALMRFRGYPAENAVVPALTKKEFSDVVEFV